MSEFRFYELKRLFHCAMCGTELSWVKRSDVKDGYVLYHWKNSCELGGQAFYPPAVMTMSEIPGALIDGANGQRFTPDF